VTRASWRVDDLAGEVAELRARGVQLQDLPGLGTVDGIANIGSTAAGGLQEKANSGGRTATTVAAQRAKTGR
jgi:hypothetical protein